MTTNQQEQLQYIDLGVGRMTCDDCVQTVTAALESVARPGIGMVAETLRAAAPTLDPAEQRLALELYRPLLAGKPVTTRDLASIAIRGMPHRPTTDQGDIWTWCALDPLIIAPLVTDDARVVSAPIPPAARRSASP